MTDTSKMKLIGSLFCKQYQSDAKFYIDRAHASGVRHLFVRYENGGYEGQPEFATEIPNDWSEEEIKDLLLWSSTSSTYPAWEVPARAYASDTLFRYWKGEKPS
jgi:hypothetical protein